MTQPTDFAAIKTRQQSTWASGDFGVIGTRRALGVPRGGDHARVIKAAR